MSEESSLPTLPPGVCSVSASIDINANIDHVWTTLVDFAKYPECRSQLVVSQSKQPLADATPAVGKYLSIRVRIPLAGGLALPASSFERITTLDADAHRAAWDVAGVPAWLLRTQRWQVLSVVGDGEQRRTRYETVLVFHGVQAYFVKWLLAGGLRRGFEAMGSALKERAEST